MNLNDHRYFEIKSSFDGDFDVKRIYVNDDGAFLDSIPKEERDKFIQDEINKHDIDTLNNVKMRAIYDIDNHRNNVVNYNCYVDESTYNMQYQEMLLWVNKTGNKKVVTPFISKLCEIRGVNIKTMMKKIQDSVEHKAVICATFHKMKDDVRKSDNISDIQKIINNLHLNIPQ